MRGQVVRKIVCGAYARGVSLALLAAAFGTGCQSFSSTSEPPPGLDPSFPPPGVSTDPGALGPMDERPVLISSRPPPAVMGGTLLALSDGHRALVADPDRDRISIVDFVGEFFGGVITLERGALPGRAVEDKSGHAYVVLRGTGEVLTIDLSNATAGERRKVCSLPRGIALEPNGDRLVVACAEGKLVNLPLSGTDSWREIKSSADVRDVVFSGPRAYVSRFRSAELLTLDADLNVQAPKVLPSVADTFREDPQLGSSIFSLFDAAVAWRAVPGPEGSVVIVHQRATSADIQIDHPGGDSKTAGGPSGGNAGPVLGGGSSTYGGGAFTGCGGIVHSAVTIVAQDGTVVTSPQLGGVVLPVDVAVSSDGVVAVASAGARDLATPTFAFSPSSASSVTVLTAREIDRATSGECLPANSTLPIQEPVVAVAFDPVKGRLLAQTREPAQLIVFDDIRFPSPRSIQLAGESVMDTGHEIFHRDTGAGISCASCHVEGTDDGRTWNFSPFGARRTQAIDVGLAGTEPFHWDGTLPTLDKLMSEVFVGRMGGPREAPARVAAVGEWIFQLPPRAPLRAASDPAAQRGKVLFESREGGCTNCHSGEKFTNNSTVDVGTGGEFQVPSLLGIAQRLPVMHNGCAATLIDRFDASCGGTQHGGAFQFNRTELEDLVAYLESL